MRKDEDDLDEKSFSFITLLLYLSLLLLLKWPFILNYKEIILIDKYIRKQARGGGVRGAWTNPLWDVNIEVMTNKSPWEIQKTDYFISVVA